MFISNWRFVCNCFKRQILIKYLRDILSIIYSLCLIIKWKQIKKTRTTAQKYLIPIKCPYSEIWRTNCKDRQYVRFILRSILCRWSCCLGLFSSEPPDRCLTKKKFLNIFTFCLFCFLQTSFLHFVCFVLCCSKSLYNISSLFYFEQIA